MKPIFRKDLMISRFLPQASELLLVDDYRVVDLLRYEKRWPAIAAITHTQRRPYLSYVEACLLGVVAVMAKNDDQGIENECVSNIRNFGDKMISAFCTNDDWIRELLVYIGCVDEHAVIHKPKSQREGRDGRGRKRVSGGKRK